MGLLCSRPHSSRRVWRTLISVECNRLSLPGVGKLFTGMESCTWYPVRDLSIWYFKLQPYVVMADLVFYGGPCPTQQNWFWDSDKLTCVHILKLVPANFIRNTWSSFWGVFTWNVFCLISQNDSVRAHTVINSASETSAKLTSLREPASVGAPNCEI